MRLSRTALALTALLSATSAGAQAPGIAPTGERIDLLRFQINDLSEWERLQRSSQSRPLTLEELELIEQSLVKSLTAVYHGRVKYPGQRTA